MRALILISKKYESLKSNVGTTDKIVRLILSIVRVLSTMRVHDSEMMEEIILVSAMLFFSTGMVGHCPLYTLLGISTNRIRAKME